MSTDDPTRVRPRRVGMDDQLLRQTPASGGAHHQEVDLGDLEVAIVPPAVGVHGGQGGGGQDQQDVETVVSVLDGVVVRTKSDLTTGEFQYKI